MTRFRLLIPSEIVQVLRERAEQQRPRECCGILAGRIKDGTGSVSHHFPTGNEAIRDDEYETCAQDMFAAAREMRRLGVHELAIYHSHPHSKAIPSRRDLERNTYGESVIHLILGFPAGRFEIRCWWLGDGRFEEAQWNEPN